MILCLATRNTHKVAEIQAKLGNQFRLNSLDDIGCKEELPETTDTIEGNSRQKAEYVFVHYKVDCLADDSGLEIDALHGAPGVHSAYYAGPQRSHADNIQRVLRELEGVENRQAHFKTVLTLATQQGLKTFEGILSGRILRSAKGSNGFGYDPIFLPDGHTKTLAEMTLEEKNAVSHRARAVEKLGFFLKLNSL